MNEEKHWTFAPQTPAIGDVQALLFQMPCWACDGGARAPGSGCVEGGPYVNIILLFDPPLCARPESCSTLLPGALPSQPHAPPLTIIKERALFGKGVLCTPELAAVAHSSWIFYIPVPPDHYICLRPFQKVTLHSILFLTHEILRKQLKTPSRIMVPMWRSPEFLLW